MCVYVLVRECVCVCVCACVRACVRVLFIVIMRFYIFVWLLGNH
jgi:hypothetical protein